MQKIEHIGIAVKNLSASVPLFEKLLNTSCYKIESVESEKVNTAFLKPVIQKSNCLKALILMVSLRGLLKKREKVPIILLLRYPILKLKWTG